GGGFAGAGRDIAEDLIEQRLQPGADFALGKRGAKQAHAAIYVKPDPPGRDDAVLDAGGGDAADREAVAPVDVGHGDRAADDAGQGRDVGHLLDRLVVGDRLHERVV